LFANSRNPESESGSNGRTVNVWQAGRMAKYTPQANSDVPVGKRVEEPILPTEKWAKITRSAYFAKEGGTGSSTDPRSWDGQESAERRLRLHRVRTVAPRPSPNNGRVPGSGTFAANTDWIQLLYADTRVDPDKSP
jgi:hypothetical protein